MKTAKARLNKIAAFKDSVRWWASKIGTQPERVQIQWMTKKWASCSTAGRICFSTDLLKEDATFQEVVIVHELLHLKVPNHGKLFLCGCGQDHQSPQAWVRGIEAAPASGRLSGSFDGCRGRR